MSHKCNYASVFALRGSPIGEFSLAYFSQSRLLSNAIKQVLNIILLGHTSSDENFKGPSDPYFFCHYSPITEFLDFTFYKINNSCYNIIRII